MVRIRKSFESLEEMLDKENIPNRTLLESRTIQAKTVLATVEGKMALTDFESLKSNKKLQTLLTC